MICTLEEKVAVAFVAKARGFSSMVELLRGHTISQVVEIYHELRGMIEDDELVVEDDDEEPAESFAGSPSEG